jgi:hypothetical protein
MKTLYTFSVGKQIEKTVEGITVKEVVPVSFCLKKPSRNEKEEAEITRAEYLAKYIRRGVLPEAILSKNYSDQGGVLDEYQKNLYTNLSIKLYEKTQEFQKISAVEPVDKVAAETALKEIVEIQNEITKFQYGQNVFFENTAEFKAKTKLIEWLLCYLTYFKETPESEWQEYFKGDSFEERLDYIESLEEKEDEIYLKIKNELIFAISLFVHLGGDVKAEDIERSIKENFNK